MSPRVGHLSTMVSKIVAKNKTNSKVVVRLPIATRGAIRRLAKSTPRISAYCKINLLFLSSQKLIILITSLFFKNNIFNLFVNQSVYGTEIAHGFFHQADKFRHHHCPIILFPYQLVSITH
jgi:hypothetical protein